MKKTHFKLICLAALILTACGIGLAQQPTQKNVALRTASGEYLMMVAGGGLGAGGKEIGKQQIFTVVDENGGEIEDGDRVKIVYESSIWREDKENKKVHRVPIKGSKDAETVFKAKRKGKSFALQTPSGKYVGVDGAAIVAVDGQDKAAFLEMATAQPPAEPTAYRTAFRTASGKYLTMIAGGGLDASAAQISPKQVFTLVDLNGGQLSDGDAVKIQYETSLWREEKENNVIRRVQAKGSNDAETVFKIKVQGKNILLQTPSGKFVAPSPDGKTIMTSDKREAASLLEAVPQQ